MATTATTSLARDTFLRALHDGAEAPEGAQLLEQFSQPEPVSVDSMLGLRRVVGFGQTPRDPIAVQPGSGPLRGETS